MIKFKRRLQWIWDYYFVYFLYNGMKHDRYFNYMEVKYGQQWYDSVNRSYEKKFGD